MFSGEPAVGADIVRLLLNELIEYSGIASRRINNHQNFASILIFESFSALAIEVLSAQLRSRCPTLV